MESDQQIMAGVDGLDCNTPRGRMWTAREEEIAAVAAASLGMTERMLTPTTRESVVDALDHVIAIVAEVKARDMTRAYLRANGDTYLITYAKIVNGLDIARRLCASYFVIVGIYPERRLFWWQMMNAAGQMLVRKDLEYQVAITETQATCNGGTTRRPNAFLPLARATQINF